MLGVPTSEDGTGMAQATIVHETLPDWGFDTSVKAISCDTTSSNLGIRNGAAALLEKLLERDLLYLPCRHHIFEIVLRYVFEAVFPNTVGSNVPLFIRFQKQWEALNKLNYKTGLDDPRNKNELTIEKISSIKTFATEVLTTKLPRDDYKEFLELTLVFIGVIPEKFSFRKPGACHHTRWMVKAIYVLKMYLFREQLSLKKGEDNKLRQICVFVTFVYVKAWYLSSNSIKASYNDLQFIKELHNFKAINSNLATVAINRFMNHLWYLSPELATIAIFDEDVPLETKLKIVAKLHTEKDKISIDVVPEEELDYTSKKCSVKRFQNMDNKPSNQVSEDFPIQKVVAKLYSRAPRTQQDEKLKNLNIPKASLVLESEKKSRSASSSRRNSDDGGRANGTSSEPPTASVGDHAWSNLHSSNSTTRTELSLSDGAIEDQERQHVKSQETAVPVSPLRARSHWKSVDSLVPEAAFGTSLSDIMESPGHKICLRDDLKCLDESDSEGARPRPGWRLVRNVTSATVAFSPKLGKENSAPTALPGTPLPSFQSKSDSKNSVYGNKDERKPSLPSYPNEKDEINIGETTPEGLDPDSLMFRDGRRRIDMVLAYEEEDYGVMTEAEARRRDCRRTFQENLIKEGLELELENKCLSFDEKTWFLKIHIPWKTEMRLAEVTGMKLPTKRFITISVRAWSDEKQGERDKKWHSKCRRLWKRLYEYEHSRIDPDPSFYAATDQRGVRREEQFLVKDRHTQFSPAQRSLLVMQILLRAKYDNNETKMGIRRLLNDSTYLACFPLHEGRYDADGPNGTMTDRRLLYLEWARPNKWYKKQPLWMVRRYFGEKIGLYFCWLGFYTKMLYAPAIVGTLCFLYGLASMDSSDNIPSKEICDIYGPGNTTLCPLCDKACQYQQLADSCLFAKLTYLFDNPATVFFAIFMSFWATTFLELWKRKQSVLRWEWDLGGVDHDEEPRPEFEASIKTFRTNPVTREKEPYLPTWQKTIRYVITSSAVLFMITIVLGAVLGTIIYRISMVSVIYGGSGFFIKKHAKIFTAMTAALINLIIIMILTRIYAKIAVYLTNLENPRTQTEYEDSYTVKIFFFEFMNFYSSLIYIAFFKGRFYDYPGDDQARKSEFFKLKGDICDPAGCLSELCIQLAIIMIGKQCFNNIVELGYPKFHNWWRQRSHRAVTRDKSKPHMAWEQDYHLQDPGRLALFDEYLEMILQYGFVTLFVAAFPLAPLFALLNNIAEIRLDAYKMVTQARRPLAERVEDIGAWYGILRGITYAAVVSNAFVIAYTSDFIPRMVYKYVYSPDNTLTGYINHSLSMFNTSDYRDDWGADDSEGDPPLCAYRGYRNPPSHADDPYGLSPHYWHVFAARLAFIVVFEHVVFGLTGLMQIIIPDVPSVLRIQMQREALLAKEAKYEHGRRRLSTEYRQLLTQKSDGGERSGMWLRRASKASDGLDAHVAVAQKPPSPQ